jgi:hypothetical protein
MVALSRKCSKQHNTTQHNTTRHDTTQHDTTRHNTTQHNTTQHNTTRRQQTVRMSSEGPISEQRQNGAGNTKKTTKTNEDKGVVDRQQWRCKAGCSHGTACSVVAVATVGLVIGIVQVLVLMRTATPVFPPPPTAQPASRTVTSTVRLSICLSH